MDSTPQINTLSLVDMQSLGPNDITIEAYNQGIAEYIKHTPQVYQKNHEPLLRWIDKSLEMLDDGSKILEIGSGTGREARYIESKGFQVIRSDATKAFVDYLKKHHEQSYLFNILKDDISDRYDMIFANAVAPHFTADDLQLTIRKVYESLAQGSLFAFSTKQGHGERWMHEKFSCKRYIHLWEPDQLVELLNKDGFEVVFLEHDIPGDLPNHTWINITAKK